MIVFRRLGGELIGLNPDLIERVEETPDTVVTLVGGAKFLVEESLGEVLGLVTDFRAFVLWRSRELIIERDTDGAGAGVGGVGGGVLRVVPDEGVGTGESVLLSGSVPVRVHGVCEDPLNGDGSGGDGSGGGFDGDGGGCGVGGGCG